MIEDELQGRSVLDLLQGKATVPYAEAAKVGYELFGLKAFFDGDWKILWMPKPFGKEDWELFNLNRILVNSIISAICIRINAKT